MNEYALRPFLTAEWRNLVILNFEVAPEHLLPVVPRGTALDLWRGRALVSLVGFEFRHTRVLGVSLPGYRHFPEINLRFYVKRVVDGTDRRAVVFLRELVPKRLIAWTARWWYNEPYQVARLSHQVTVENATRTVEYVWRAGDAEAVQLRANTVGSSAALEAGSEAAFITEHYWGYTTQRDGGTIEYRVEHPPWRIWEATEAVVLGDVRPTYGSEWARVLAGPVHSAYVAEGSPVTVYRPHRLSDRALEGGLFTEA